jgi:hypothetical protein
MSEKRQTSQGYIIRILQHFATKLRNSTNFVMLFQAVMKFLSRWKFCSLGNRSISYRDKIIHVIWRFSRTIFPPFLEYCLSHVCESPHHEIQLFRIVVVCIMVNLQLQLTDTTWRQNRIVRELRKLSCKPSLGNSYQVSSSFRPALDSISEHYISTLN